MKYEFLPYRILVSHTAIAVEETLQRSFRKFYLILDTSGISSFQHQLANFLSHSLFFIFVYLLLYLFLSITGEPFLNITFN